MNNKIPISIILAVYNEERFIEECLRSVQWADEVIVIDGGSTDRTLDIIRQFPVKLISSANAPAETQRLKGLKEVHHDWFFLLDADERVGSELQIQIEEVLKEKVPKAAYYVLRRNYYRNRPVYLHHPDYQLRLFHKSQAAALPDKIHRIPEIQGETGRLSGQLVHRFFTSVHDYLRKLNRYTEIEASYAQGRGETPGFWKGLKLLLIKPLGRFLQYYFLKQGYRDGLFGLFYSVSSAYYDFVVACSLWIKADNLK